MAPHHDDEAVPSNGVAERRVSLLVPAGSDQANTVFAVGRDRRIASELNLRSAVISVGVLISVLLNGLSHGGLRKALDLLVVNESIRYATIVHMLNFRRYRGNGSNRAARDRCTSPTNRIVNLRHDAVPTVMPPPQFLANFVGGRSTVGSALHAPSRALVGYVPDE
jgi:hypothetical protein